jgi:hypothetical protein
VKRLALIWLAVTLADVFVNYVAEEYSLTHHGSAVAHMLEGGNERILFWVSPSIMFVLFFYFSCTSRTLGRLSHPLPSLGIAAVLTTSGTVVSFLIYFATWFLACSIHPHFGCVAS